MSQDRSTSRNETVRLKLSDNCLWLVYPEGMINLTHLVGTESIGARRDIQLATILAEKLMRSEMATINPGDQADPEKGGSTPGDPGPHTDKPDSPNGFTELERDIIEYGAFREKRQMAQAETSFRKIQRALRSAPSAGLSFEQVRNAIYQRMGGHTVGERDLGAWTAFLGLLKQVQASECSIPVTPSHALRSEPVAWIEHHKGGDNLVWEQTKERCTPLYTRSATLRSDGSLSEHQIRYMCEYAIGLNGAWSRKDAEALRDLAIDSLRQRHRSI